MLANAVSVGIFIIVISIVYLYGLFMGIITELTNVCQTILFMIQNGQKA